MRGGGNNDDIESVEMSQEADMVEAPKGRGVSVAGYSSSVSPVKRAKRAAAD